MSDFKKYNLLQGRWLYWLGRFVPVRHRYVVTRDNRLRLRYVIPSVALCLTLAVTSIAGSVAPSQAIGFSHVGGSVDHAAQSMGASQKRLQRYEDTSVPEGIDQGQQQDSNGVQLASFTPPAPALKPKEEVVKIGKGDTLAGVLQKTGLGASESYRLVKAIEGHYDPRKIRPGQEVRVRFNPVEGGDYEFSIMQIGLDPLRSLSLTRSDNGQFKPEILEKEVITKTYASQAEINVSLYGAAEKAGVPMPIIAKTIHIFSWDVDFQRDIRKGDTIEVLYEQYETAAGEKVKNGDVIYARLNVNGQDIPVYRFEANDGRIDYFTPDGVSIRKALMQTPIDGARLSSGFGKRHHPVLGYAKMHKGLDFAAPSGTPIFAAGDGTIDKAGRWSSYGNYIRIRHNATLKTAYAHLQGFAPGISTGKRVKQGQVIGYVGTTGRSTGPHLHYEVLENGNQVNPKTINLPQGETLKGAQLAAFKKHIQTVQRLYANRTKGTKVAARFAN